MDIIHLLPDSVANQIAAGEVIQRPASCLKELVENSLDAGAQHITVIVRDAGRTLLQVIDDGIGMSETDVRMAFERHATSKITNAQDIFALRTMGFRGEALASICAVAQVEVKTRRKEDEVGTLLEIHGSNVVRQEICQCPVGTTFKVKNLFYNVPVRRKFLKTDQTELRNLLNDFYRIVLVYPHVHFSFVNNDEVLMDLSAGTEKQRIEQVFGKGGQKTFTGQLVDLKQDSELVSIRGFIGKPEMAGRNAPQYFFVNGRYMRHPYFHKAIMNAYAGMIPGELVPSYFVYFNLPPDRIDVNIHPTKTEIKFADEQAIFQILLSAVRESLGKFNLAPSIDFDRNGELDMPVQPSPISKIPTMGFDSSYNPFKTGHRETTKGWDKLYTSPTLTPQSNDKTIISTCDNNLQHLFDDLTDLPTPYQYANKYILLPIEQGLLLINQHRAHLAVLYEQYMEQIKMQKSTSQQLLFPEVIDLTLDEMTLMQSILPDLQSIGFVLEQLSKYSFSILAIPALLDASKTVDALHTILADMDGRQLTTEWRSVVAKSMAQQTAIPYGKSLTEDEMRNLVKRLLALHSYVFTKDGKRIINILTDNYLSSLF